MGRSEIGRDNLIPFFSHILLELSNIRLLKLIMCVLHQISKLIFLFNLDPIKVHISQYSLQNFGHLFIIHNYYLIL